MSAVERPAVRRDHHPTKRAQYISETHKDKENRQHQQVNKAQEHQEKACQKASKAAEREAYQNNTGRTQVSAVTLGNDPGFSSQTVSTPARGPDLVARNSTVLLAPHRVTLNMTPRLNTLTPEKAAELLRLHEAVLAKQAMSPVAALSRGGPHPSLGLNNTMTRSPSPMDEALFDEAIEGLVDFNMDGDQGNDSLVADNNNNYIGDEGSRSPSPSIECVGKYCRRASDGDDNNNGPVWKAVKIQESKGRPKAANYEPFVCTIFGVAWALYCGRLCMEGPMPDHMQEVMWAKLAWKEACKRLHTQVAYDAEILKMITSQGSHLHGKVKTKVRPYVADEYGFETSTKQSVIDRNIMLARELKKDFAFTCSPNGNKGLYGAKIIQKGVNTIWFRDKKDKGDKTLSEADVIC
ncbi:uncharacterized protein EDB91DRAFT_1084058 [Suillus paluster]|uniref:uncharacterized protein n=1 Tax=Suillus paluster TaxID=48578 RepID=UPI001B873FF1|nr:uncharacterized protein EDB91DRAFT_1084058 [Suillus paluster]KAG1734398.1 hypothetical protein EDB91DRAFT_1084058 [Suillus paluster]